MVDTQKEDNDIRPLKSVFAEKEIGTYVQANAKGFLYRPKDTEEVAQRAKYDAARLKKRFS